MLSSSDLPREKTTNNNFAVWFERIASWEIQIRLMVDKWWEKVAKGKEVTQQETRTKLIENGENSTQTVQQKWGTKFDSFDPFRLIMHVGMSGIEWIKNTSHVSSLLGDNSGFWIFLFIKLLEHFICLKFNCCSKRNFWH